MNSLNDDDTSLLLETCERMEALRASPDEATIASLEHWIRESPRHAASYRREADIDSGLCELARCSGLSLAEQIAIARDAYADEARAERPKTAPGFRRSVFIAAPVAIAAALGLAALAWGWWNYWSWTDYRALAADSSPRVLADGSSIQLYAGSDLRVRIIAKRRDARLTAGGGMFHVPHDPEHAFRVVTEHATFEDLGTAFNLLLKDDVAGVYVVEGTVRASGKRQSVLLQAGGSADVLSSGVVTAYPEPLHELDAGPVTLEQLAREVNRRNHVPQIRIEGDARRLAFSSSVDLDDPDTLVRTLATYNNLRVVDEGNLVTVRVRNGRP